jgi:hypothetical protein
LSRPACALCLAIGLHLAPPGAAMAAPEPGKADLIKAAIVEKVARFIDWPVAPALQFTLCAPGEHPQLAALRAYYERASIARLPVQIRPLRKGEALAGCQAAFLLPGAAPDGALRAQADKEHVLLIGEGADMASQGAHIGFFSDMNRLRLEVNRKALEASGLKASFHLLEVAKIVE